MNKLSIILIVIAVLVVAGANFFIASQDGDDEALPIVADTTTIRSTTAGEVIGFTGPHGARAWLGMPFAKAPVNELRWRAPRPPESSSDVLQALSPENLCPQFASQISGGETPNGGVVGNEDCLYLNVWAPPNASDLPVMYWIHGGGNTIGDGGSYSGPHSPCSAMWL